MFILDAYFKRIKLHIMNSPTSQSTVDQFKQTFASHDLSDLSKTGDDTAFTS